MLKTLIDFNNPVLNVDNTLYNSTARFPAPDAGGHSGDSVLNTEFRCRNSSFRFGLAEDADSEKISFYDNVLMRLIKTSLTVPYVNRLGALIGSKSINRDNRHAFINQN